MIRIAGLASHGGTILQSVLSACDAGTLNAELVLVISNNSDSKALSRAANKGIATLHLSATTHPDPAELDSAMCAALKQCKADYVLLAGYMKKLGPATLAAFPGQLLNTHPSLLPKYGGQGFYGRKVHEAVYASAESSTGATVHLVEGDYDTGPILAQVTVPITRDDTVESIEHRVKTVERNLVLATLSHLAETRIAS